MVQDGGGGGGRLYHRHPVSLQQMGLRIRLGADATNIAVFLSKSELVENFL